MQLNFILVVRAQNNIDIFSFQDELLYFLSLKDTIQFEGHKHGFKYSKHFPGHTHLCVGGENCCPFLGFSSSQMHFPDASMLRIRHCPKCLYERDTPSK
ncbi:hypothetical protein M5D96_010402 [Drosophila gunungcola]|uniref:Uncharacterized protein n=1 Tax=Drosophila gunungcola TaxID=103775 RepID=A0A9P9YGV4_9MUSC|nr:hypothetical protein M5D96_010402 [Drosophila gunungcola]